jgi:hexosaminidase
MNYNYRVPTALPVIDTMVIGSKFTYEPKSVVPGAKIYYTLNGRDPLDTDWELTGPITFTIPANEKREFKTRVITPSGRRSIATRVLMCNRTLIPAASYAANSPGLKVKLIKAKFTSPDQVDYLKATDSTRTDKLNAEQFKKDNSNFGVVYEGFINITTDGPYNFNLGTYNDTQLFIDGEKVTESENVLPLAQGFHKIRVVYIYNAPVQTPGNFRQRQTPLRVFVTAPGTVDKKELDSASLYY